MKSQVEIGSSSSGKTLGRSFRALTCSPKKPSISNKVPVPCFFSKNVRNIFLKQVPIQKLSSPHTAMKWRAEKSGGADEGRQPLNIFDRLELVFENGFFIWVYVNIMILCFSGFMDLSNCIIVKYIYIYICIYVYIRYFWPYYYTASVALHRCMVAPHRCMIFYESIRGPCFFDPPPCFLTSPVFF